MKIQFNAEIKEFLKRCEANVENLAYNDFLNVDLKKNGYDRVLTALKEIDYPEFKGDKASWPSLYISTQDFLKSPYHQAIQFKDINEKDVSIKEINLDAHQLFNLLEIQKDPDRELKDWMVLRALDTPLNTLSLSIQDEVWMLDVPSESATIDPIAQKASGKVITFGLGIGYFIYMASLNPEVISITVIEKHKRVIELFKKYILPQFKLNIECEIIEGDAFDYFNEGFLSDFDTIFVDIHQSSVDGLAIEEALLENYNPPFEKCDFWIEGSNLEVMPWLIFLHLKAMKHQKKAKHPYYQTILDKIDFVLSLDQRMLTQVDECKDMMYDTKLHRKILSSHV